MDKELLLTLSRQSYILVLWSSGVRLNYKYVSTFKVSSSTDCMTLYNI